MDPFASKLGFTAAAAASSGLALPALAQTKKLKIGCGFNVVPMWHPLRLAEDYATADILTRGRTIFVGGQIGWNAQCEFETDDLVGQTAQTLRDAAPKTP